MNSLHSSDFPIFEETPVDTHRRWSKNKRSKRAIKNTSLLEEDTQNTNHYTYN